MAMALTSSLHVLSWQLVHPSHLFESTQVIHSLKHSLAAVVVVADDLFIYVNVSHHDLGNEFEGFESETLLQRDELTFFPPSYSFITFIFVSNDSAFLAFLVELSSDELDFLLGAMVTVYSK